MKNIEGSSCGHLSWE